MVLEWGYIDVVVMCPHTFDNIMWFCLTDDKRKWDTPELSVMPCELVNTFVNVIF